MQQIKTVKKKKRQLLSLGNSTINTMTSTIYVMWTETTVVNA